MTMPRCYAEPARWRETSVLLPASETHHLLHVLRLRPGAEVEVFDGQGRVAQAILQALARDSEGGIAGRPSERCGVLWIRSVVQRAPPRPRVILLPAVCQWPRMDELMEQSVPMGVTVLAPVTTARTVPTAGGRRSLENRVERWRRIVLGSAKQCGAAWLPEVKPPVPLDVRLSDLDGIAVRWVASLEPEAVPLREAVHGDRREAPAAIAVAVGPEGDFTPEEYAHLREAAFVPVSLGRTVLRTEMAAIYLLCVVRYEFSATD